MLPTFESSSPTDSRQTWVRYLVLAALCVAAAIAYVQRNGISVMESTIRLETGLDKDALGSVMGSFFLTYAIFQIPSGWLADRIGARLSLALYAALWSLSTVAMAGAGMFSEMLAGANATADPDRSANLIKDWLYFCRLLAGAAQAGIFPCAAIIVRNWFPLTDRGLATGWIAAFQQVGAVLASALTGLLLTFLHWQVILALSAIPGFLFAGWFYVWFRNQPHEKSSVSPRELALISSHETTNGASASGNDTNGNDTSNSAVAATGASPSTPWLGMLNSPAMWCICGQQFFRAFGYIFFATWFPTYLQETRGVSIPNSGLLTSLPLLGTLFGSLCGGYVSDFVMRTTGSRGWGRKGVAIFGLWGCAAFTFSAFLVDDPNVAVLIISAGGFCAALAGPAGYAMSIDMGGEHVATVFSTMNMSGNFAAYIFPIVVPLLLKLPGDWNLVLAVFGTSYIAAGLSWVWLRPDGTVFDQKFFG